MDDVKVINTVRGNPGQFSGGSLAYPHINERGDYEVALALPLYGEIVRRGASYQVITATAAAPVIAIPTTTALISLWNGESAGGKSYVIDTAFVLTVAATAAQQTASILAMLNAAAIPTAIANTLTPKSMLGNKAYQGNARVAVGTTVINDGWFPLGTNAAQNAGATNNIGSQTYVEVFGRYIVPPQGQFNLSAISAAATASSIQIGLSWHEIQLDLTLS